MQTRNNVHGLARWLGVNPALRFRIGYGLIFPDSFFGDALISAALQDITIEPPQKIFVDKPQMANLHERVVEIMAYWQQALETRPLTWNGVQSLIEALCPNYDGTPTWAIRVQYNNHFWLRLTEEQTRISEIAYSARRMIITGWPGTGKTLIGIDLARRKISSGAAVLVVTYNNLLCDYLKSQINIANASLAVFTWHGLCAAARKKLKIVSDPSQDWLKKDCLGDLQSALAAGLLDNYDLLIIDETQALQPAWTKALLSWFSERQVVAFCDDTQVFKFETETIRLNELCQQFGGIDPFHLTIVMRMPRAVTERLLSIKEISYQLTSPRDPEPDSAQELLIENLKGELEKVIAGLLDGRQGLQACDVLLLTKLSPPQISTEIQKIVSRFGIRHESVWRFRGMESPVVIIWGADELDDSELFCAYSRATTVCIALFDAESVGWNANGKFQKILLSDQKNLDIANSARSASRTASLVTEFFDAQFSKMKTVKLAWCTNWSAWIVQLKNENDVSTMWIDFLLTHYPWPVFYFYADSHRNIWCLQPSKDTDEGHYVGRFLVRPCDGCQSLTLYSLESRSCIFCSSEFTTIDEHPTPELLTQILGYDQRITEVLLKANTSSKETVELPLGLAALGAILYGVQRSKRDDVIELILPDKRGWYRIAFAMVYSRIVFNPVGTILGYDALSRELYSRYSELEIMTATEWRKIVASAFAVCAEQRKWIKKETKGFYKILPRSEK